MKIYNELDKEINGSDITGGDAAHQVIVNNTNDKWKKRNKKTFNYPWMMII